MLHEIREATAYLKRKGFEEPEVGLVLGTGLKKFIEKMDVMVSIPYAKIPHFPVATMEFNAGHLVMGICGRKRVLAMQGRFHFYEGYSMKEITFPVRVMKNMGIKELLISNAAGGINPDFRKGDLVVINDHINLQSENPLAGPNEEAFGPRFPDMSMPYDQQLISKLMNVAGETLLKTGVYAAVNGPNLETRAEYRYLGIIGADMVGMSTVPEVIVARHMGLPVLAVSVITDECDPDNLKPLDIKEILDVAEGADEKLSDLFARFIARL